MTKVALLIGVSEYAPGLNPLPAAVKDVAALQRILQDAEMGGFNEVKVLTNPDPQSMQYEIETLFTGRSRDDLVLLFFSGHGIKDDSNNLYFATRITQKNPKGDLIRSTAVPARFIHEVMNNSRAKRQAIILDCCFSGAFDPALQTKDDGSVDLQGQLGAEGRVVLTSSSSTQYSFEQQGSELSLYTRYLVEGIETGAGDRDEDGKISMRELHDYASSKVHETAPNMTPKLITLKDMGFEIVLAKAKVADPKLRYRRQVERYSSRGTISSIGRTILGELQTQLKLSPEVARDIEAEVLRPYQERLKSLQQYRQVFLEAVEQEYPLRQDVQSELEDLREVLGLRQEDIEPIEQEIVAQVTQKTKAEREDDQQKLQHDELASSEATIAHQQEIQVAQQKQNEQAPQLADTSNNLESLNHQTSSAQNRFKSKSFIAAASSILILLFGGILLSNKALFSNKVNNENHSDDKVTTYTAGALSITGNRQHVCNVLLPRGPGIGGSFFYPEEEKLWQELQCKSLYCDLNDPNCRSSLKSQWVKPDQASSNKSNADDKTDDQIVDQILQSPTQPIPQRSYSIGSLSTEQMNGLNGLFSQFNQVDNSLEPVEPGSATTYQDWKALCIGEQGQSGCPKSAKHEIVSYGNFSDSARLWTSRGWVLYKP